MRARFKLSLCSQKNPYHASAICIDTNTDIACLFLCQCSSEADPLNCIGRQAAQNKTLSCEQKHIESVNKIILKGNSNMVELNSDIYCSLNHK